MAKSRETSQQRRRRVQSQQRSAALSEAKLKRSLESELARATGAAALSYPKWERTIKEHRTRLETILNVSLARTTTNSAALARELTSKPLAASVGKFLPTQDELLARVAKAARERAGSRASEISETTRTRIANAVARGVETGEGPAAIARRVRDEVSGFNVSRARTIARTETAVAQQSGEHAEMLETSEALGMPMTKTWVATEDERTRETHTAADGQTVDIEDTFTVGAAELRHPGDPGGPAEEIINCRCAVVYQPK